MRIGTEIEKVSFDFQLSGKEYFRLLGRFAERAVLGTIGREGAFIVAQGRYHA